MNSSTVYPFNVSSELEELRYELAETRFRLREVTREKRLADTLSHASDLKDILSLFIIEVRRLDEIDGCAINLIDPGRDELSCEMLSLPTEYDGVLDTFRNFRYALSTNDINVEVYKQRQTIVVNKQQVERYSRISVNQFLGWKCQSLASIPLMLGGSVIGTVVIFKQKRNIQPEELDHIETKIIPGFFKPIHNALLYADLKRKEESIEKAIEEQQHFLRFISEVNNLTSVSSIYDLFCKESMRRFGFDFAGILMREDDRVVARKHAVIDDKYAAILENFETFFKPENNWYDTSRQDGACLVAMDHNIHVLIPDVSQVDNLPMSKLDKQGLEILKTPRTLLIMPIRKMGQPVGVIWLWSLDEPVNVDGSMLKLVDLLGTFIGTAIANAELYSQVEEQKSEIEKLNDKLADKVVELHNLATTDKLTDLKNFAYFQEELQRRIMEYRRCKDKLYMSLVIVDIDHFKRFNDTHGHVAGNIALMDVAGRLAKQARKMDVVCRYGGEEFVAILPKCDLEGAKDFGERLRQSVESTPVKTDKDAVPVTISVGVAEYLPDEAPEAFIERADKALYQAKQGGRNRVEVSE